MIGRSDVTYRTTDGAKENGRCGHGVLESLWSDILLVDIPRSPRRQRQRHYMAQKSVDGLTPPMRWYISSKLTESTWRSISLSILMPSFMTYGIPLSASLQPAELRAY